MGKCKNQLHDLSQTFTDIKALKVMNICQIYSLYHIANKNYGTKTVGTVEPATGSIMSYMFSHRIIKKSLIRT